MNATETAIVKIILSALLLTGIVGLSEFMEKGEYLTTFLLVLTLLYLGIFALKSIDDMRTERGRSQPVTTASKRTPAWALWLRCVFMRGGHNYGRWWWPERPEAHCLCDDCADKRTPANRKSWLHRERAIK